MFLLLLLIVKSRSHSIFLWFWLRHHFVHAKYEKPDFLPPFMYFRSVQETYSMNKTVGTFRFFIFCDNCYNLLCRLRQDNDEISYYYVQKTKNKKNVLKGYADNHITSHICYHCKQQMKNKTIKLCIEKNKIICMTLFNVMCELNS